jgi:hypothetical protein
MREPARCGLYTVCEVDEEEVLVRERERDRLSNMMSDESFTSLVDPLSSRLSWTCDSPASSEAESEIATPNLEEDDPFTYDMEAALDTMTLDTHFNLEPAVMEEKPVTATTVAPLRPRRPPPHKLQPWVHPYAVHDARSSSSGSGSALLPSLPIRSPKDYPSRSSKAQRRRRSRDDVDLVSALEDLLRSCGEDFSDADLTHLDAGSSIDRSFPLPPARSPVTPLSASFELRTPSTPSQPYALYMPSTPIKTHSRPTVKPAFVGDHSFLRALSSSPVSTTSSRSGSSASVSSRKALPSRSRLPREWAQAV